MTELIVHEILDATPLSQEFIITDFMAVERVRPHLAVLNIDKTTNDGYLVARIKDSGGTLIDEAYQTFSSIVTSDDASQDKLGNALQSTNAEWHGQLSFIFDKPVNLQPGTYNLEIEASYSYTFDTNWIGWVAEHDDPPYDNYDGYTWLDSGYNEQSCIPKTFEIWTWQVQRDFGI